MRVESLTIADFYSNPDEVRQYILTQDFDLKGNYPGFRTDSYLDDSIRNTIQEFIRPFAGEVTWWGDNASGAFQYTIANDRSWIHTDTTDWAGVLYLNPDAPFSSGTGLFRHKKLGIRDYKFTTQAESESTGHYKDYYDITKWDLVDRIGNVYNRLILYRGDLFHSSLDYFGRDKEDGRLFQTFFFNTEK